MIESTLRHNVKLTHISSSIDLLVLDSSLCREDILVEEAVRVVEDAKEQPNDRRRPPGITRYQPCRNGDRRQTSESMVESSLNQGRRNQTVTKA
jgi:hypothetical protein